MTGKFTLYFSYFYYPCTNFISYYFLDILEFDNTYSWIYQKEIYYKLTVVTSPLIKWSRESFFNTSFTLLKVQLTTRRFFKYKNYVLYLVSFVYYFHGYVVFFNTFLFIKSGFYTLVVVSYLPFWLLTICFASYKGMLWWQ